ncbi:hypothetical protein MASR2M15_12980 [Anaerolineales bacterium]
MRILFLSLMCLVLSYGTSFAQDDLIVSDFEIKSALDIFGLPVDVASGQIENTGTDAYTNITIYIEGSNTDGELIAEGFGYLTDACNNLLEDAIINPGQSSSFSIKIDYFTGETDVQTWQTEINAEPSEPFVREEVALDASVQVVFHGEVVAAEWLTDDQLILGQGCNTDLFTQLNWWQYDLTQSDLSPLAAHPQAAQLTEVFIRESGITNISQDGERDPLLLESSHLFIPANNERAVFQTDIHTIMTVQKDGQYRRIVHDRLHQNTLQGYIFAGADNFLAYYFGALGEEVAYFIANFEGRLLGGRLEHHQTSQTIPGLYPDASAIIIGGDFGEGSGYYYRSLRADRLEIIIPGQIGDNRYPAPLIDSDETGEQTVIYAFIPVDEGMQLICHDREQAQTTALLTLPFAPENNQRAQSWLSPDGNTIALAMDQLSGGLWLIDLQALATCKPAKTED